MNRVTWARGCGCWLLVSGFKFLGARTTGNWELVIRGLRLRAAYLFADCFPPALGAWPFVRCIRAFPHPESDAGDYRTRERLRKPGPGVHLPGGVPRSVPRSLGRCLLRCIPRRNRRSVQGLDPCSNRRSALRNASCCALSSGPHFGLRNDPRSDPVSQLRTDLRSLTRSEARNDPCRVPRNNPRCR